MRFLNQHDEEWYVQQVLWTKSRSKPCSWYCGREECLVLAVLFKWNYGNDERGRCAFNQDSRKVRGPTSSVAGAGGDYISRKAERASRFFVISLRLFSLSSLDQCACVSLVVRTAHRSSLRQDHDGNSVSNVVQCTKVLLLVQGLDWRQNVSWRRCKLGHLRTGSLRLYSLSIPEADNHLTFIFEATSCQDGPRREQGRATVQGNPALRRAAKGLDADKFKIVSFRSYPCW